MEGETSTGLNPNIAGLLCYLVGWVTGIVFLLLEPNNRFVRFHAIQSIIVFGAITILSIILTILTAIFGFMGPLGFVSIIFGAISTIIWILALILWIVLMVKAYQGEYFMLPVAGNMAEKQLG